MLDMLRNRLFLAVTSGHFAVDVLNSVGAVLLAVLATPLALNNAQIGLALTLYTMAGALSQPIFGWAADRFQRNPAMLAGLGVVWTALCFLGVAFAPSWAVLLPLLLLAALGSGLFHPVGTALAVVAHPQRAGTATAIFFFAGQVGLALGPFLAGVLFQYYGTTGLLPMVVVGIIGGVLLIVAPTAQKVQAASSKTHQLLKATGWIIAAFILLVAIRSSIQAAYMAFLPKLFADRNWEPTAYGLMAGLFMFTAAIGNLYTGDLADRFGMRVATVWPLVLSVPAGLICLWSPTPLIGYVACAFAGFLVGGQHSVLVVHAQRLLPTGQGFAAGLILGFTFAAGGIGTWLGGLAADSVGLLLVLQIITLLGLPAALLALTLPGQRITTPNTRPDEEQLATSH